MAGEALLSGYFNPQPSLAACATACNSNAGCTAGAAAACARCSAFYYCDLRGACLVDPTGNTAPAGACFLLVPALALSIGVYKIASGPQYGTSGAPAGSRPAPACFAPRAPELAARCPRCTGMHPCVHSCWASRAQAA